MYYTICRWIFHMLIFFIIAKIIKDTKFILFKNVSMISFRFLLNNSRVTDPNMFI